ncbi:MAG TPA: hypothetical protein PLZ00_07470, partial [Mangrovimonas sp.]|nr:hypothetical protein [Mangrovimonas sp.]
MKSLKLVFFLSFLTFGLLTFNSCKDDDDNSTPVEICNDGLDNDGDGFTDCEDNDCNCEICDDGLDNDGDGFIDCEDVDCDCPETECGDGVDNDG